MELEKGSNLVSTNPSKIESGYLKIEVTDSGCGIKEEDIPKLFQKFGQVGTLDQKRLGTGLGLWILKDYCTKMEGNIIVHSVIKHGSTFIVLIKCPLNV